MTSCTRRTLVPALGAALALILCTPAAAQAQTAATKPAAGQCVLVIHAGAEDYPPNPVLEEGVREGLGWQPGSNLEYFTEYLEYDLFDAADATPAFADFIRRKYRDKQIDVVVATTSRSLEFVLQYRRDLFPRVPVVYAGVGTIDERVRLSGAGVTGIRIGESYKETLQLALSLHPSTEQVFIIAKTDNKTAVAVARATFAEFQDVTVTYLTQDTLAELLKAVRAIPPHSIVLYLWYRGPLPEDDLPPDALGRMVADAAPAPVYGVIDLNIGGGVVGGVVRSIRATGVRLGEMTRRVLDGTRPQDIPVETAQIVPTFDWRQLRRWSIDESRLPAGSEIRFKAQTAWEIYQKYAIFGVIVIGAQLALIVTLLINRAQRQQAEDTLRTREVTLRTSYYRIRELAGRLINAQEAARAGIARDLHDDVCQQLAFVSIAVSTLRQSSGDIQDGPTQQAFAELEQKTQGVFDAIRRLSHELHPASLRLLGPGPALKTYCAEVAKRNGVEVIVTLDANVGRMNPDVAVCLFRIVQESLRNGIVHGGAGRFSVTLARAGAAVELTVSDDGVGFDLEAVRRRGGGLGLVSMEERARVVGGEVQITTGPRTGTTVHVTCPAEPPERREPTAAAPAGLPEVVRNAG